MTTAVVVAVFFAIIAVVCFLAYVNASSKLKDSREECEDLKLKFLNERHLRQEHEHQLKNEASSYAEAKLKVASCNAQLEKTEEQSKDMAIVIDNAKKTIDELNETIKKKNKEIQGGKSLLKKCNERSREFDERGQEDLTAFRRVRDKYVDLKNQVNEVWEMMPELKETEKGNPRPLATAVRMKLKKGK